MKAKTFIIKFLFIFIFTYTSLYSLYFFVNPEQKFNFSITDVKFFYTKDYSRKQYEELKSHNATLVFGTSQTHMLSTKMYGNNILNFHNLYGEPDDILNFLEQLDKNQINNIDRIIYLIDLRAGATRIDENLIRYNEDETMSAILTIKKIKRSFMDLKINSSYPINNFLNKDGSIEYINSKEYIKYKPTKVVRQIELKYNNMLIKKILNINEFAIKNNIKILFITPVVNDEYIKSINFSKLTNFFSSLLLGGIESIKLFYFIDGFSNLKNKDFEYISFIEQDHLNPYFIKRWLFEYILTENKYVISNRKELNNYIDEMKRIQKKLSAK